MCPSWGDDQIACVAHSLSVIAPSEERLTTGPMLPKLDVSTSPLRESQAQVVTHIARANSLGVVTMRLMLPKFWVSLLPLTS